MKRILFVALALVGSLVAAQAQTPPGLIYGQVPTAAQWNAFFAAKQDYLGSPACVTAGCTMTGPLITAPSGTPAAGFNLTPGVAPTSPNNGDVWVTTAGMYVQVNGATVGPLNAGAAITAGTTATSGITSGHLIGSASNLVTDSGIAYSTLTGGPFLPLAGGTLTGNLTITPSSANTELLTLNLGALTANTKAINITGTFNSSGTTFDAPLFMNIVNTASTAGSKLFDFQVGSISFLNMTTGGILQSSANGGTDLVNFGSNIIAFGGNGNYSFIVNENSAYGVGLAANRAIGWSSVNASGSIPGTPDSYIYRDGAAQILGFSSANGGGTSPFSLRVYNTSSSSNANYERGVFGFTGTSCASNVLCIGTELGGSGTLARNLEFIVGGVNKLDYGVTNAGALTSATSIVLAAGLISGGSSPTGTTGSCSGSSFAGGRLAGTFVAATCASGTYILSALPTAPNGYSCDAHDQTTTTDALNQSASTTTSVTFTGSTVASDVVAFKCMAF